MSRQDTAKRCRLPDRDDRAAYRVDRVWAIIALSSSTVMETPTMSRAVQPKPSDHPERFLSYPDALYEIEDGQVVELPEMGRYAATVAQILFLTLNAFLAGRRIGWVAIETMFILDVQRDLWRRPDVAFVSFDRWPPDREITDDRDWEIAPDLPIEVVSPNDTHRKLMRKVREYLQYGARQVWVLNPTDQSISIYSSPKKVTILGPEDELDGGEVLPGFRVPVASRFRRTVA